MLRSLKSPTREELNILNDIQEKNQIDISEHMVGEWIACRANPLYYILNYVYLPEIGGKLKYSSEIMHPKIRRVVRSIMRIHACLLMASRQLGKALALSTPIPQPYGNWTTMGRLKLGDYVLHPSGKPTKVVAVTDIMYNRPCYKICFDYGEEIIADENHIWEISHNSKNIKNKLLTTKEVYELKQCNWSHVGSPNIKISKFIHGKHIDLPIEPYVLGLWLGDGSKESGSISLHEDDYNNTSLNVIKCGYEVSNYKPKKECNSGSFTIYGIYGKLKELTVFRNKHIPRLYFSSSRKQRLDLVRGLMDSDGNCCHRGSCEFYQKDKKLILDMQELLASLGIKSRIRKPKIINGQKYYTLKFTTRKYYVFNLNRKRNLQKLCKNDPKNYRHYIKSIEPINSVPVRCIQVEASDGLFLCGRHMIPTHNSSIAAALLSWASNFYPGNRALILNMQKRYAQENLTKIKFIQDHLPKWMRFDKASRSEIKEYIELKNGSRIDTLYPSSTTPPDSIARSLTLPILYIDEVAFIPHIDKIYGAAQPTLTRAREQAKKNNYPYFIFATSTPNGVEGIGKFFADIWDKAMDTDQFFMLDDGRDVEDWVEEEVFKELLNDPLKNNFARVIYHWSEDPTKDEEWYNKQKKELNFDMRKIRQELDLQFVGGQHCIFDDEVLSAMESKHRVQSMYMKHGTKLELFIEPHDISVNDYYLIGVDTASSLKGCFNAIEIFSFKEFQQIAELKVKLGSLTKYSEVVESVFQWLYKIVGDKIILCIENNSIGKATIEGLLYHPMDEDFSYAPFIVYNKGKEDYGIYTGPQSKEMMISAFQEYLLDNPKIIKSNDLIAQLHRLERTNAGTVSSKFYTDLFMAACLAAYIRKTRYYEISPLVDYTAQDFENSILNNVKSIVSVSQKNLANPKNRYLEHFDDEGTVLIEDVPKDWSFFGG